MKHPAAQRKKRRVRGSRWLFTAGLIVCLAVGIAAVWNILAIQHGYAAAQEEYDRLREYAPRAAVSATVAETPEMTAIPVLSAEPKSTTDLTAINPDYIGWITINGTGINYPVVRGQDNIKYLTASFSGEKNPSGSIFMDAGCTDGFDGSFAVLFGHNMKDGTMFAGLNRYLEDGYLAEHPEITVTTPEGETHIYHIFAVKVTDTNDTAYTLAGKDQAIDEYLLTLGGPERKEQTIMLSTCINGNDRDKRLLVFAAQK